MKNTKNIPFVNPAMLYIFAALTAITAGAIIYVAALDNFIHSLLFISTYALLLALIIMVAHAFKVGQKEIVKSGVAAILTVVFYFHAVAFHDMLLLNSYYFFSGNMLMTTIGLVAIILFILFVIVYINHFRINSTSFSNTRLVNLNKSFLVAITILSALQVLLVVYNDAITGREIELHLALTYLMHVFVSIVIISVEGMINQFREAKEHGVLAKAVISKVGVKAAKKSGVVRKKK